MSRSYRRQWVLFAVIGLTVIVAMMLQIMPVPGPGWRPSWVALVVVYWVLVLPHSVSVGWAWWIGLWVDLLLASPLGAHAFSFTVLAFLATRFYQRFWTFSRLQQSLIIGGLLFLERLFILMIHRLWGGGVILCYCLG